MKKKLSKKKALILSELTYRRIFETAQEGIVLLDFKTGMILDVNKFLIDRLGFSKANFLGKHIWDVGILKDAKDFRANFATVQTKKYVRFEDLQLVTKAGKEIQVEFIANAYKADQVEIIQCDIIDISDRKEIELKASNISAEYEEIVDTIADALLVLDRQLRVVSANQTFYTLFKVDKKETVGQLVYDLGNKQWNIPELKNLLEDILPKNKHVIDFMVRHTFESIGAKTMLVSAKELMLEDGQPEKIIIAIEDVTREFEEEDFLLYSSDIKYHKLFNAAKEMIMLVDRNTGTIINANPALTHLLGYKKEELAGGLLWESAFFENIASTKADFEKLQQKETLKIDKITLKTKTGGTFDAKFSANTYKVADNSLIQLSFENITALEIANQELLENSVRLGALFDEAADPMAIHGIGRDGKPTKFININKAFCKILGYTREEALELSPNMTDTPASHAQFPSIIKKLKNGKRAVFETVQLTKDGRQIPTEISSILFKQAGKPFILSTARDITKRKAYEKMLLEKNVLIEEAENIGEIGNYALDIDAGLWTSSPMMDKIFGINKKYNHATRHWLDIVHTEDKKMMADYFANNVLTKHEFFDKEYRVTRIDDKATRWVHGRGKLYFDQNNKPIRMVGTIQDVTNERQEQNKISELKERFEMALEVSKTGFWELDLIKDTLVRNLQHDQIFGYKKLQPRWGTKILFKHIIPEDREMVRKAFADAMRDKKLFFECRIQWPDKSIHWITATGNVMENGSKTPIKMFGTVSDITESKQNINALEHSHAELESLVNDRTLELQKQQNFLSSILENVPDMIFVKDAKDLKFELFNKAGEELIGQKSETFLGKSDRDFFTKKQADFFIKNDRAVLKSRKLLDIPEESIKTKRGKRIIHTKKIPLLDKNGKPLYLLGISEDITEKKERLDLIAKSKEIAEIKAKDEAILGSIGDAVFATDTDGKILLFNKVAEETSGVSAKNAIGQDYKKVFSFIKESDGKPANDFVAEAINEKKIIKLSEHILLTRKNGSTLAIADSASPVIDKDGTTIGCVVVYRDATHEHAIDRAKTEFVSLASHQLRTPLTGINWLTEMFLHGDFGEMTKKQRENIDVIYKSGKRMATLVSSLLNVSKLELNVFSINPKLANISDIVRDVIQDLNFEIKSKEIKINIKKAKMLPRIRVDHTLTRIICLNLLTNAVHYSPPKSTIDVELSADKNNYYFAVKDHGIGIPKEDQEKIFTKLFRAGNAQSFHTDGNGLGLYITKLILEATSGKISFSSTEGKGSTFNIQIPLKGMTKKKGAKALETI